MTDHKPENPLSEAGTVPSLDGFYGKEPDDLTDEEIDQLIAAHRAERERFEEAERKREEKARKPKGSARKSKKAAGKSAEPAAPVVEREDMTVEESDGEKGMDEAA